MQVKTIFIWILRLVAAIIMLQTLFFKFTGSEESVYIFTTLGIEPAGRIGSGIAELIASVLILWPRTTGIGALLGLGVMSGALFSHLFTPLGLEIKGDGGLLFTYAVIVFVSCVVLAWTYKGQLLSFLSNKKNVK
jgi:uncharacterized membrane protein YphA (DoxX/SURF4 family)